MITKKTNENSSAYNNNFSKINQALNDIYDGETTINGIPKFEVNEVREFFAHLGDLYSLVETQGFPKELLMMPADEPLLEIDANTRVITIPEHFRKNGISIQGDHLSETVYFVIDRYFDKRDLATTNIYINWKMGNIEGRTAALYPSVNLIEDKIVFGWPIDNRITVAKGNVQFSITCEATQTLVDEGIGEDREEVIYSFNTLTATAVVNATLMLNKDTEPLDFSSAMMRGVTNSSYTPEGMYPLYDLYFAENGNLPRIKNFTAEEENAGKAILAVQPVSKNDNVSFNYSWYKDGNKVEDSNNSQFEADGAGIYSVAITGQRTENGKTQTTKILNSNNCVIPKAVKPNLSLAVDPEFKYNFGEGYEIIDESIANQYNFIEIGENKKLPKLIATVSCENDEDLGKVAIKKTEDSDFGNFVVGPTIEIDLTDTEAAEGTVSYVAKNKHNNSESDASEEAILSFSALPQALKANDISVEVQGLTAELIGDTYYGSGMTLNAIITELPNYSFEYQWLLKKTSDTDFSEIDGATSNQYILPSGISATPISYKVKVNCIYHGVKETIGQESSAVMVVNS